MTVRYALLTAVLLCSVHPGGGQALALTRFNPKANPIFKVCVLPADATLTRMGMKGGASLPKESDIWAEKLEAALKHAIEETGAQVTGDLSADALVRDEAARQAVVHLKQKYENIAVQLRKKPGGVEKGRYTLGDEVALAPCAGQAESLAFINAHGTVQTAGRKAFNILVNGAPGILTAQSRYDVWIALVDAKSGEVAGFVDEISISRKTEMDPDTALSQLLAHDLHSVHVGWTMP